MAADCASLAADYDWAGSEFGPQEQWAPAVGTVLRILLEAAVPMAYCHGTGHEIVYNDAFADILGSAHPSAWGERATVVLPEIWPRPGLAEVLDNVFSGGSPLHDGGDLLGLDRRPHPPRDGVHLGGSYSAVRDSDGSIVGVLVVAVETTSAVRRIEAVTDLVTALAVAVTVDDVAMTALQHAVITLGCERASVCLGDGEKGGWRLATWRGTELWDETAARLPLIWSDVQAAVGSPGTPGPPSGSPEAAVARTGRRLISESHGQVILPMSGGVAGSIGYLRMQRQLSEAQMVVLEASALLISDAMARALDRESRNGAAELLQRTLLPQVLPSARGVILAGRYLPVTTVSAAGGDFYDSFTLPDGRLVLAVGDVTGRGVDAVRVMGQVRAGLRGAVLSGSDPKTVFTALDELVRSLEVGRPAMASHGQSALPGGATGFAGELFVTALIGILDPTSGELLLASAGHVPPAVVRRRAAHSGPGSPWRIAELAQVEPGPPLGIDGDRPILRLFLDEGDAVVAFTDGLLEPRQRSVEQGLDLLLGALASMASTEPRSICQHLVDELVGQEGPDDDVALLVLLRDSAVHHADSVLVPPQAGAVRGARRWVRGKLEAWGLGEDITAAAVMGVSELVTNVVLHAGTPAIVSLELARRLLVTVEDTGERGAPRRRTSHSPADSWGRGLALVEAISDAMGHDRSGDGSTVWFEIELDHPAL